MGLPKTLPKGYRRDDREGLFLQDTRRRRRRRGDQDLLARGARAEGVQQGKRRAAAPEEEQRPQGFTVERAAEVIDDLPPDVPRESAVRIVRGTLTAAGIRVEDLERSTRAREAKLNSEMELARERQEELRRRTENEVRSLEEEIKRVQEGRDAGIAEEEERISRAADGIGGIKRVRAFFDFPEQPEEQETTDPAGEPRVEDPHVDETQIFEPFDADETRVFRRDEAPDNAFGDASGGAEDAADTSPQDHPPYRDRHGPTDRR